MKKFNMFILFGFLSVLIFAKPGFPHCQVPCGIYNDQLRIDMIKEDIETVEKACNEINSLSRQDEKNYNQLVRWVNTKESHAEKIMETVSDYFMAQRLILPKNKKDEKQYQEKLLLLHKMLVFAMKSKQSTDLSNIKMLKGLAEEFEALYFEKE